MSKKRVCFASCLVLAMLVLAVAACKPADRIKPRDQASTNTPATGSAEASVSAPAASGGEFDERIAAMIRGAAKMQASAVACNLASQAQTDQAIAGQRARYVAEGYDKGAFDRLHGAAYQETLEKFKDISAEQKAQACQQIKAFGENMRQMGEEAQKRMQDQQ